MYLSRVENDSEGKLSHFDVINRQTTHLRTYYTIDGKVTLGPWATNGTGTESKMFEECLKYLIRKEDLK